MPAIWHPPRHAPDPELIPFELPEDGLALNYANEILEGRYQLDRPIGPGGTSTVWSGKDLRTGARIAVKILNADMHDHLFGLFGQEGRVAARHTCPHLVQAIDFGKHEDCAFTVFKFVDGISLFNLGRDTPLPWRRAARIAIQILAALHDLHTRGLVHCDLHPSNVLVQPDLEGLDFAIVIDVGFAFVIPPKRITNAPEPTKYIFGMRRFIAPERRAGDAPGPRSDLYSLGVLLWELLTAQILPAYELDPGLAIPTVRTIAPGLDIPDALDRIVMRALSDVDFRFRDALEMAQALRDVLETTSPPELAGPAMSVTAAAAATTTALPIAAAEVPSPGATLVANTAPPTSTTPPVPVPGVVTEPTAAELPTASATIRAAGALAGDAGSIVAGPTAGAPAGDADPIMARPGPLPAVAALSHGVVGASPATRKSSGMRLAAACLASGLAGAGAMYLAMVVPPRGALLDDAPAMARSATEPTAHTVVAVADVDRATRSPQTSQDGGDQQVAATALAPNETSTANDAAIPARVTSPPLAEVTPPRRTRTKRTEPVEQTFEKTMAGLVPQARACARQAGIAETPQSVRVRGDAGTGQVQSIRVVNMSLEHSFARCISEAIRKAGPPLRERDNSFTFFSRGGSQ